MNFGLYFQTTQAGGGGGARYFPHFLLVHSFVLSPMPAHKIPTFEILCLQFLVSFFTLCGSCSLCFRHTTADSSLTASFPPEPFHTGSLPPSLSQSFPWVAEWRLVLGSVPTCYIPIAQWFLIIVLNTTLAVNVPHRCRTGGRTESQFVNYNVNYSVNYRGYCLTEVVPTPQMMSL